MLQTFLELARVDRVVRPFVLTKAVGLSVCVLPDVLVAIFEEIATVAMSQILPPFTFIFVFVGPGVHAIALCFAVNPLADV